MNKLHTNPTKESFANAFIALLRTTPFQRISVNTICAHTSLSRTTFYQHFGDKFDLAMYCYQRFDLAVTEHSENTPFAVYLDNLLTALHRERGLVSNLLVGNDGLLLKSRIYDRFVESTTKYYEQKAPEKLRGLPPNIIAVYYASGFLAYINLWIESDFELDKEEIIAYILEMHKKNPYI